MTRVHAGISLKPEYYDDALAQPDADLWFEVHPENYMVAGGPRLDWLAAIGARHPLSFHGVGLSLAGTDPLNEDHLAALAALVTRFDPARVSEHLAWSQYDGVYFADLLPVLRTQASMARLCARIDRVQEAVGRRVLIENPTHYVDIEGHTASEPEFLGELVKRTGCGLLVDINNLYLSKRNVCLDPLAWIRNVPQAAIGEFHLAGHVADPEYGDQLLIDSHDQPVIDDVWQLFADVLSVTGARPTLIERDDNLPSFAVLIQERERAQRLLDQSVALGAPTQPAVASV